MKFTFLLIIIRNKESFTRLLIISFLDSVNVDQMCARYWPIANGVEEFEHMYIRNLNESNVKTAQDKVVDDVMQRRLEIRCG